MNLLLQNDRFNLIYTESLSFSDLLINQIINVHIWHLGAEHLQNIPRSTYICVIIRVHWQQKDKLKSNDKFVLRSRADHSFRNCKFSLSFTMHPNKNMPLKMMPKKKINFKSRIINCNAWFQLNYCEWKKKVSDYTRAPSRTRAHAPSISIQICPSNRLN